SETGPPSARAVAMVAASSSTPAVPWTIGGAPRPYHPCLDVEGLRRGRSARWHTTCARTRIREDGERARADERGCPSRRPRLAVPGRGGRDGSRGAGPRPSMLRHPCGRLDAGLHV